MNPLEEAVLASLVKGSLSGRTLQRSVESRIGHRLSFGTLSRVVADLEADEALTVTGHDQALRLGNRAFVTYELTVRGRQRLDGDDVAQ